MNMEKKYTVNHHVVQCLQEIKSRDSSKIVPQGISYSVSTGQILTSFINCVSVMLGCKKLGIEIEKYEVLQAVKNVMKFFTIAKTVGGVKAGSKLTSSLVKPSTKRVFSSNEVYKNFWRDVSDFEAERSHSGCVIVSKDDKIAYSCVRELDQPVLLISVSDLMSRDFSKQLGQIMLKPTATLGFEVEGVDNAGLERLITFLKCCKSLFDSRLRIVIFSSTILDIKIVQLLEKTFLKLKIDLIQPQKKQKLDESQSCSAEAQKIELTKSKARIGDLEKEVKSIEDELKRANSKMEDLEVEVQKGKTEREIKRIENEGLQGEIEQIKDAALELEVASIREKDKQETLTKRVKDLEEEVASLRESNSGSEKTILAKNIEIESMEIKIEAFESERLSLQEVITDHDNASEAQIKKSNSKNSELQWKCRKQEQEMLSLQNSFEALQQEMNEKQSKDKQSEDKQSEDKQSEDKQIEDQWSEEKEVARDNQNKLNDLRKEAHNDHNKNAKKFGEISELETESQVTEESLASVAPSCQTVRNSAVLLSTIRKSLDKNGLKVKNSVTLAYRSIKDLKCDLTYTQVETESKCDVEIVRGRNNIMRFPELLKFSGEGDTDKEAKSNAFEKFIVSVKEVSDL